MLYEFACVSAYVNLCYCGRAFVGQAALLQPYSIQIFAHTSNNYPYDKAKTHYEHVRLWRSSGHKYTRQILHTSIIQVLNHPRSDAKTKWEQVWDTTPWLLAISDFQGTTQELPGSQVGQPKKQGENFINSWFPSPKDSESRLQMLQLCCQGSTKYPAPRGHRPPDSPTTQLHLRSICKSTVMKKASNTSFQASYS